MKDQERTRMTTRPSSSCGQRTTHNKLHIIPSPHITICSPHITYYPTIFTDDARITHQKFVHTSGDEPNPTQDYHTIPKSKLPTLLQPKRSFFRRSGGMSGEAHGGHGNENMLLPYLKERLLLLCFGFRTRLWQEKEKKKKMNTSA